MKNLLLLLVIAASIWAGMELLWTELVGSTESSFGNFKAPQLASLLDTYWDVSGWSEFSALTQQK